MIQATLFDLPAAQPRSVRSHAAEANFRRSLNELGATLLDTAWKGSKAKYRAICPAGHLCTPTPHYVRAGDGICVICGGRDPATAEAKFCALLTEAGAELLEPYRNATTKHKIRCHAGHVAYQKPCRILQGIGICRACAGRDPASAEAAFRARVEELGGKCLFGTWRGAMEPHHVACARGHDAYTVPARVQQGQGICWTCAGTNPVAAEAAYRELIVSLGGMPLWERWPGNKGAAAIRCPEGHEVAPRPNDVMSGSGMCRICAGREWDAFYVVTSGSVVKFGVTSGDPRPRLGRHAAQGFTKVIRLATSLPGTVALDAERSVKAALAMAGDTPVQGSEYFDISCLGLIMDVAGSWLGPTA